MVGFGGNPWAGLGAGLGAGITQGAELYQQLMNEQLRRKQMEQQMQLAQSAEGRAQSAESRAQQLFGPQLRGAELGNTAAEVGIDTGRFGLERARTTAGREDEYLAGLGAAGVSQPDAVAAILGKPSATELQNAPELSRLEIEAKKAAIRYTNSLAGAASRSGRGSGSGSTAGGPGDTRMGAIDTRARNLVTTLAETNETKLKETMVAIQQLIASGQPLDTETQYFYSYAQNYFRARNAYILENVGKPRETAFPAAQRQGLQSIMRTRLPGEDEYPFVEPRDYLLQGMP